MKCKAFTFLLASSGMIRLKKSLLRMIAVAFRKAFGSF